MIFDVIILFYLFIAVFVAFPVAFFTVSSDKRDKNVSLAVLIPAKTVASSLFCLIWIVWLPFVFFKKSEK